MSGRILVLSVKPVIRFDEEPRTGQCAVERLFARMAAHVCSQSIARGVRDPLARAVGPLAAVLLLATADVVIVQMLHEIVHVFEVAHSAVFPFAHCHLVMPEVIVGRHTGMVRRRRHRPVCVFRDVAKLVGSIHRNGGLRARSGRVQAGSLRGAAGLLVVIKRGLETRWAVRLDGVRKVVGVVVGEV